MVEQPRSLARQRSLALEDHDAILEAAVKPQEQARGVHPGLVPAARLRRPGVQARATEAAGSFPRLAQPAAVEQHGDAISPGQVAIGVVDVPFAEPEVELAPLRLVTRAHTDPSRRLRQRFIACEFAA